MRTILAIIGLIAFLTAGPVASHQEMSFTGQVVKLTGTEMTVRTPEGRNIPVPIGPDTRVVDGQNKVGVKNIKVGQTVEVITFSDSPDDLSDADIRIVSPAPKGGS